jgi:hypothetical protein
MKGNLLVLALLAALPLANAQEKLPKEEALTYAKWVGADAKQLNGTPIATEVDLQQPVAVKEEPYGGMVLPQKDLKAEALAKAGDAAVPIGQLWLLKLTPMQDGSGISQDRLRLATVQADGEQIIAPQCALAVKRNAAGNLELLVYGKSKEPVLTAALKPIEAKQASPLELDAERDGDSGKLTLKILGKYQASFSVTELEL